MSEELKACPLCESPAAYVGITPDGGYVQCQGDSCGASVPGGGETMFGSVSILRWNRRDLATRPSVSEEKIEEMADEINQAIFANTGCGVAQLARMDVLGILRKHLIGEVK